MIKYVFLIILLMASVSQGAFRNTQTRYHAPYDFLNILAKTFPEAKNTAMQNDVAVPIECYSLTDQNRSLLGENNAVQGKPSSPNPDPGFLRWISLCIQVMVDIEIRAMVKGTSDKDLINSYLPKPVQTEISKKYTDLSFILKSGSWNLLTDLSKKSILTFQIERLIGPDQVLKDFGLISSSDKLAELVLKGLDSNISIKEQLIKILTVLMTRDEFLLQ